MGGAQFFWRVTRTGGKDSDSRFTVEEFTLPLGEPVPRKRPYKEKATGLSYEGLATEISYIGYEVAEAFRSSPRRKKGSFCYERHMSI